MAVLNGNEILMTVSGHAGNGQVVGVSIITTPNTSSNTNNFSILSINNVSSSPPSGLKIDESSGALSKPLSCHIFIRQLQ